MGEKTGENTSKKVKGGEYIRFTEGYLSLVYRGGSRTAATSKMELFVIIVNGFQPLTFITKCSILDVAAVLDPPLGLGDTRVSDSHPPFKVDVIGKGGVN